MSKAKVRAKAVTITAKIITKGVFKMLDILKNEKLWCAVAGAAAKILRTYRLYY
mgnify:CR=1 FL=1